MPQDEKHRRQEEAARKILRAEGNYDEFPSGQGFHDRERSVRQKCIELFGEYQYNKDLFEV